MISLKVCENREEWDEFVLENDGHPLQLWGWGETKAAHGWKVERLFAYDMDEHIVGAAQVLRRRLPWPFNSVAYIPRGPVVSGSGVGDVLGALTNHARSQYGAVVLTIEPDWSELPALLKGWRKSSNTILIPQTLILDLSMSEDELLAPMNKKTRQYIRKSGGEEGVELRQVKDREELEKCMQIYRLTAERAGFALHDDQYYYDVFENLGDASPVFAAYRNGWPIAFLWLAISAHTAFELYGGMNDDGQELRANYALKWHAICKMKEWGVERYDMNGLVSDGVSNFKRGFADHEDTLVGTYDKPLSPLYVMWNTLLPYGKKVVRALKR
ncbi:MAG: peptidoglycan bridge formation glycyltransferase FemA/FemB family protein [Candidatus Nomurabacteria bacterium]|nr:MAG: peptidoglycan bridge formation glycyltransferase FemA/FemB family protein [Candidatus Nomurabacteria bacterium]